MKKKGFRATQITVEHEPEHKHRHLHHITAMIDGSTLTAAPKRSGQAHLPASWPRPRPRSTASTIEKVHFHEVGAVDSIADIVGSAIGFDLLGIERIICSPVPTGHGFVEIAHGRCSIPAPATGELLRGVPLAPLDVEGELTTPTGAAIVAALADDFGPLPAMTVDRIGYGAGQKDFPQANILRLLVGEVASATGRHDDHQSTAHRKPNRSSFSKPISTTPPAKPIGHAVDRLWSAGALDVSLTPIQMKKGRPGVLLSVQARPADAGRTRSNPLPRDANAWRTPYYRTPYSIGSRRANGPNTLGYLCRQGCDICPMERSDSHRNTRRAIGLRQPTTYPSPKWSRRRRQHGSHSDPVEIGVPST